MAAETPGVVAAWAPIPPPVAVSATPNSPAAPSFHRLFERDVHSNIVFPFESDDGWLRRGPSETLLVEPIQAGVRDLGPATVDGQRVTAICELDEVRHRRRMAVLLDRGLGDRFRDGVVPAAHHQQQRPANLVT